ncbi:Uncharacterised protein [Chlamydia abortus]|nr:Uncharacterised protein [Chlamydia abortus]
MKTIPPCPIATHPRKQPFPVLFIRSLQVLEGHSEVPPEPSLLRAQQAQFPQPFFIGEVLQPSAHPSGPALDPFHDRFLCWGPQAWAQYCGWGLARAE